MDDFLKSYFLSSEYLKKGTLPGDGGHRKYLRITSNRSRFLLMSCGEKDLSLNHFIEIQKRFSPFVSAPKIFHKDLNKGLLLLEDLGDETLELSFFKNPWGTVSKFYHQALRELIAVQNKVKPKSKDPVFDKTFFLRENEIAIYHLQTYINRLSKQNLFDKKSSLKFKKNMLHVLSHLKPEDYFYCHRDYHSRNLMIKKNQIVLIDFQDGGLGPWFYDLTSLIYDSYIPLRSSQKTELIKFYFDNLPLHLKNKARSISHIDFMTKLQFLQRGFKACGCFAAFKNRDKKPTHLKYIEPTLKLLTKLALELSYQDISDYSLQMLEVLKKMSPKEMNY